MLTGILAQYKSDMYSAVVFFSGGLHRPKRQQAVDRLTRRLSEIDCSGYEFCFFAMNKAPSRPKDVELPSALLLRTNWYCSERMWGEFQRYKEDRMQEVRDIVSYQRDTIELRKRGSGIEDILLTPSAEINTAVRLDYGLEHVPSCVAGLLDRYALQCLILLLGSPEYLEVCTSLNQHIMEGGYVAQRICE